jgi:hypothetical protein
VRREKAALFQWVQDPPGNRSRLERGRQRFVEIVDFGALIEEVRFAVDSPLEGEGFEPSVPRKRERFSRLLPACVRRPWPHKSAISDAIAANILFAPFL